MTKVILSILFLAITQVSCEKAQKLLDSIPIPPSVDTSKYFTKDTVCGLMSQSGYRMSEPSLGSYVGGFEKTFNGLGKVEKLNVKIMNGFYSFDSLFYTFYYNRTNANSLQYSLQRKAYMRIQQTDNYYLAGESGNGERTTVLFDPVTSYVTNYVEASLTYEYINGRLNVIVANKGQTQPNGDSLEFRGPYFHYDNNGNLIGIGTEALGTSGSGPIAIRFTHNTSLQGNGKTVIPALNSESYTFALSEIMDWLPQTHKDLVTSYEVVWGYNAVGELYIPLRFNVSNYRLNDKQEILSFDINDGSTNPTAPDSRTITNQYDCVIF